MDRGGNRAGGGIAMTTVVATAVDIARRKRVLIGTVRGRLGKSGIMRGDVVTHVNDEAFAGDALELLGGCCNHGR